MAELITTLEFSIANITDENVSVVDAEKLGFDIGNYFQIDDEIFEIRTIVTSNTLYVKRALFGSTRSTHTAGALVRRISKVEEPVGTITPGDNYGTVEYPPVVNESFSPPDTENSPIDPETYFPPSTNDGTLDPFPPTLISFNSSEYEVARTYGTLRDPKDVGSFAVGKLAVIGPQDEPSNFVAVDVSVEIASNISKNETTGNTITEYTSFYSRPNLWRNGGLYDVDTFDNAFHFRVLPIQEGVLGTTETILPSITATFYGSEKTRVYLSNLSGVELNHFLVQSTYFPSNLGNRSRIIGVGGTYVDLNTEHSFVGISTTATASVVNIKTSNVETEFGYYFDGPSVNFDLIDWSYGFYYGDPDALKNCNQPTHKRWGVFVETSPWNPCDPNSGCSGIDQPEINQTWNFFEDLTLYGDYRSIGSLDQFHPEPLVQILRPKHAKRGLYVKDIAGIGTEPDRRVQLFVDNTNNPCPDKTHAIVATGTCTFQSDVGIGITNPTSKLHVIGNAIVSGIVTATSFVGNLTGNATTATTATNCSRQIINGNGMNFTGGALNADRTITLGTPGTITGATTNAVTTSSHTHALSFAVNLGVTPGSTAGPVITSSAGTNATIPTATASASGAVTTGTQTWAGTKTFSGLIQSTLGGGASSSTRSINVNGVVESNGYATRTGLGGSGVNVFNIEWTGGSVPRLWIDSTLIGTFAFTSDYRIKRDVGDMEDGAISRIMQLRPVTYRNKDYGDVFRSGENYREGFIAHEVAEIIPSGASGKKDAENEMQSLNLDSIISVLTKALQEAIEKIETLEVKVSQLEAS